MDFLRRPSVVDPLTGLDGGISSRTIRSGAPRLVSGALFLLAAGLLTAGFVWPHLTLDPRKARTREQAEALLDQVTSFERSWAQTRGRYVPIVSNVVMLGPATPPAAPRLTPEPSARFSLDAFFIPAGGLQVRVVTRPEAIGQGWVTPMMLGVTLPPVARPSAAVGEDVPPAREVVEGSRQ